MGGQPESGERYYALESLRTAQVRIMELTQQMAVQRVQVEVCKDSDIAAARDLYSQLQSTRTPCQRPASLCWRRRSTRWPPLRGSSGRDCCGSIL